MFVGFVVENVKITAAQVPDVKSQLLTANLSLQRTDRMLENRPCVRI